MLAPLLHHVPGPDLSPPDHSAGLLDLMLPMLRFAGKWCHHMGVGVRKQVQPGHEGAFVGPCTLYQSILIHSLEHLLGFFCGGFALWGVPDLFPWQGHSPECPCPHRWAE